MRLTFVGHATVRVELAGTALLTDPVLRGHVAFLRRTGPVPAAAVRRGVEAVLVSHLHHDHCDLASLRLLGRDTAVLVPPGTERFFRRHGFGQAVPMTRGRAYRVGAVEVVATPAAHDGRRAPFGPAAPAVGFVVRGAGAAVYFAGDTGLFPGMRELAGTVDVALLPVWGWGPTLGPGHLDPATAARAAGLVGAALAVPIHWGTLRPYGQRAPSPDRAGAPADAFAAEVRRLGLPTEVRILPPGGSLVRWGAGEPIGG